MNLSLTPISDITYRIGCTDVRSAEKRCSELGIKIHIIKKRKYVIEEAVNRELEIIYINDLRRKYPKNYKEIYEANKEGNYLLVEELINSSKETNENKSNTEYKPKGSFATDFIKNIKS